MAVNETVNPYVRWVPGQHIDVYDVLVAFDVRHPALQHAVKKLLAQGSGEKSQHENVIEARQCITRYLDMQAARDAASSPAASNAAVVRPFAEWHEDIGPVLWWYPDEPPYAGTPLDDDWPGYHIWWSPMPDVELPTGPDPARRPGRCPGNGSSDVCVHDCTDRCRINQRALSEENDHE